MCDSHTLQLYSPIAVLLQYACFSQSFSLAIAHGLLKVHSYFPLLMNPSGHFVHWYPPYNYYTIVIILLIQPQII